MDSPSVKAAWAGATATTDQQPNNANTYPPIQPTTSDFHLDTIFNPVWMAGPNVFSFAQDGTVIRPDTFSTQPCPGYRNWLPDPKPWKNVAITEQDDAEWEKRRAEAFQRAHTVGKWQEKQMSYRQ